MGGREGGRVGGWEAGAGGSSAPLLTRRDYASPQSTEVEHEKNNRNVRRNTCSPPPPASREERQLESRENDDACRCDARLFFATSDFFLFKKNDGTRTKLGGRRKKFDDARTKLDQLFFIVLFLKQIGQDEKNNPSLASPKACCDSVYRMASRR